jgi:hypothetical protein
MRISTEHISGKVIPYGTVMADLVADTSASRKKGSPRQTVGAAFRGMTAVGPDGKSFDLRKVSRAERRRYAKLLHRPAPRPRIDPAANLAYLALVNARREALAELAVLASRSEDAYLKSSV